MLFGVSDDGNTDAETSGGGALWNGFQSVVGAFGVDVRAKIFEERLDARFAEEDHVVYGANRGDEKRASVFIENGTAGAFQRAYARICVDTDDENVALAAGAFEIADVADVKRIEAAVGKNDLISTFFMLRQFVAKRLALDDFGCGAAHVSGRRAAGLVANCGEKFPVSDGGCAAFHHDKTAGDIGDVRGLERGSAAG